jgi:hypothetical protein
MGLRSGSDFIAAGLALPKFCSGKACLAEFGTVNRAATENGQRKRCGYKNRNTKSRGAIRLMDMRSGFDFVAAGLALPDSYVRSALDTQPILRYALFATRTPHLCIS